MATNRSPLDATVRCRAGPSLSATTAAQKPGGSVRPPLSGSHAGAGAARPVRTVTIAASPATMKPVITRVIAGDCTFCPAKAGLYLALRGFVLQFFLYFASARLSSAI